MPEVALHDVDRHTIVEQLGGAGMSQPVCLTEPQGPPRRIGQAVNLVEFVQCHPVGLVGAGTLPLMLVAQTKEQVLRARSEEHTSELQSRDHLVCRLLLEKKNEGS